MNEYEMQETMLRGAILEDSSMSSYMLEENFTEPAEHFNKLLEYYSAADPPQRASRQYFYCHIWIMLRETDTPLSSSTYITGYASISLLMIRNNNYYSFCDL
jgi:hypothetical protein